MIHIFLLKNTYIFWWLTLFFASNSKKKIPNNKHISYSDGRSFRDSSSHRNADIANCSGIAIVAHSRYAAAQAVVSAWLAGSFAESFVCNMPKPCILLHFCVCVFVASQHTAMILHIWRQTCDPHCRRVYVCVCVIMLVCLCVDIGQQIQTCSRRKVS